MNSTRRWYELLLAGMAAILILAGGITETPNVYASYVADTDSDSGGSESESGGRGPKVGRAYKSASPTECSANTYAWILEGQEGSVYGVASAWGWYLRDWTWTGAPGEAPGGTLDWSVDGSGDSYAEGTNTVGAGENASSSSDAESLIWGYGSPSGSPYGGGEVWGSVEDGDLADCGYSTDASPAADLTVNDDNEDPNYGNYAALVDWSFDTSNSESISAGTTYIYYYTGVDCEASSAGSAADGGEVDMSSDSGAAVGNSASFTSN